MSQEEKVWRDQAKESYEDALYLFNGSRYGAACFFCQQTIEKLLKALIIKKGKVHPKIHDLIKLAKDAETEPDEKFAEKLRLMSRHYYQVRYPDINKKIYIRKEVAEQAISDLKELYLWLEEMF